MNPLNSSIFDQVGKVFYAAFSELRYAFTPKNADCVFIIGPRNQGDVEFLKRHASDAGIRFHFIGDGENPVSKEMIQEARSLGIIGPNTEVVCMNHGVNFETPEGKREHRLQFDQDLPGEARGSVRVSTEEVLRWLREPLTQSNGEKGTSWGGNVHFMACQVGSFRKQFPAQTELWKLGHVYLHGSSKAVATDVVRDNCAELIHHIARVRRDSPEMMDPLETARLIANNSVDTLTLLGGDFEEPLVVRAPKTLPEFMPDHLQARWRQQAAEEKLAAATGVPVSTRKYVKHETAIKAKGARNETIGERQVANYLLTRLLHLKSKAKLELLKSDLAKLPAIANLRFLMRMPPLAFICSYVYHGTQEVTATDIALVLLDHGARINDADMTGGTALHHAARRGEEDLIELLVSRGADIHQRDKAGRSVLHWACVSGQQSTDSVKMLLKHCKGLDLNRPDKRGFTPLHLAIMAKNTDLVELLLEAGADPTKKLWFWQSTSAMAKRYGDGKLAVRLQDAAREWRWKPDNRASV